MKRCKWVNLNNEVYVAYHDFEWGVPKYDDHELFELLILEMFQAGLSWEIILKKRESFRDAFDNFDIEKIINYDDLKISELMENNNIIRNKRKIIATINNAKVYKEIQKIYSSFRNYIWSFTNDQVIYGNGLNTTSDLSDKVSLDLKKKGMSFVGSTIIYSYLQAIGIINDHEINCFKYENNL